jgi:hypothetical protein
MWLSSMATLPTAMLIVSYLLLPLLTCLLARWLN